MLVWSGTHAHAPVTVAAQPQLFATLNVEETVKNLAKRCTGFWRSREFQESVHDGHIVALSPPHLTQVSSEVI